MNTCQRDRKFLRTINLHIFHSLFSEEWRGFRLHIRIFHAQGRAASRHFTWLQDTEGGHTFVCPKCSWLLPCSLPCDQHHPRPKGHPEAQYSLRTLSTVTPWVMSCLSMGDSCCVTGRTRVEGSGIKLTGPSLSVPRSPLSLHVPGTRSQTVKYFKY